MPRSNSDTAVVDVQYAKQATTSDVTPSNGTDLHIYNAQGVVIDIGSWTDGTFAFDVEESDDDSTYTSVDASDLSAATPTVSDASTDDTQVYLDYTGDAKYLRVTCTVTGSPSTGLVFGLYALGTDATEAPVR